MKTSAVKKWRSWHKMIFRNAIKFFLFFQFVLVVGCGSGSSLNEAMTTPPATTLVSITVLPDNPVVDLGTIQQFSATGRFADNTTQDMTFSATWISSDTSVATITNTGMASLVTAGITTITATVPGIQLNSGNISGSSIITVKEKRIIKKGTIASNIIEVTPFVFNGQLYRVEWMRTGGYLRIVNHDTGQEVSQFGNNHAFPCAYVENGTVYVVGTKLEHVWYGNTLTMFTSTDLTNWLDKTIFSNPDYAINNTSLTKVGDGYAMSIEVNWFSKDPPQSFAARFLESSDLETWTLTPDDRRHGFDRYSAPHCLRWANGWYYLFYLEYGKPTGYEQYVTRSRDLINWEYSPLNPVLSASPADKNIYNMNLTGQESINITTAIDINNSDIDFTFFNNLLIINYSWGDQFGTEFLAEAEYYGTEVEFLERWFPL